MEAVQSYKCLSCGSALEFEPESQKWKCHFCSSEYTKEDLDAHTHTHEAAEHGEVAPELNTYHCTSCGAELIADATTSATFCLFCKSPTIIKSRFVGKFKPKALIPFKLSKAQAEGLYKKWIRKCLFAPASFKNQEEIQKITGMYAPYWVFDCLAEGSLDGEATRVSHYTRGDYNYTLTKYYHVVREGRVEYEKVPVDSSTKLDDELMQKIEPFDYKDITDFSMQYLSGFLSEKYDVESEQAEGVLRERVASYLDQRLMGTAGGYSTFVPIHRRTDISDIHPEYVLLPVYLLTNSHNGKNHAFIVNGQTGKVVGDTPISRARQLLFAAGLTLALWVTAVLGGAFYV